MKKRVLFVDDNPRILQGLRRMLRPMQGEWETEFAGNGQEALQILEKASYDVVVSDMRMPEMNGAQLLNEVKNRFPSTIRIILSGQADQSTIMQAADSTHQYLSKPCNCKNLQTVINRACDLRNNLNKPSLKKLIAKIGTLPALPKLYAEVMDELKSLNCSTNKVGAIISKDIGISIKILQMANSAFFGFSQKITSAHHAVEVLGLDIIKGLVLAHHIFSEFDQTSRHKQFSIDSLWDHSMNIGGLALKIAQAERMESDKQNDAFTAGLIHDIGLLIVAQNIPEKLEEVLTLVNDNQIDLLSAEKEIYNTTHTVIGAYLLELWGVPYPIIETVIFHHHPGEHVNLGLCSLTLVHIAHILEQEIGVQSNSYPSFAIDKSCLEELGLLDRIPVWKDFFQRNTSESN